MAGTTGLEPAASAVTGQRPGDISLLLFIISGNVHWKFDLHRLAAARSESATLLGMGCNAFGAPCARQRGSWGFDTRKRRHGLVLWPHTAD